ncbi:isoprenoid biosynthesis enzyme family protein [Actinophytocola sediminis]
MTTDTYPDAAQFVPLIRLADAVLADLRRWTAAFLPGHTDLPLVGAAFGAAVVGPWATPEELRHSARMAAWAYAFDDHLEQRVTDPGELGELVDRCLAVVHTGQSDPGNPLLHSLSAWQHELARLPGYPPLASLWQTRFAACLRGHRYDWTAGRARERGSAHAAGITLDVAEYLDHADSISLWLVNLPRWVAYGGADLPARLDVLVPAVDDLTVAVRLANDLATIDRELNEPGQNNILMYAGVTTDWVRDQLTTRLTSVRRRLDPLLAENFLPAMGVIRLSEWATGSYAGADLRDLTY